MLRLALLPKDALIQRLGTACVWEGIDAGRAEQEALSGRWSVPCSLSEEDVDVDQFNEGLRGANCKQQRSVF